MWQLPERAVTLMGIVNATPDSFSDGRPEGTLDAFLRHARKLIRDGADVLDIGGESTRPGAEPVSVDRELARVIPLIAALRGETELPLSIDTRRAAVAEAALRAGVDIVNDVSGFCFDPEMEGVLRRFSPAVVAMHSRGTPETMQAPPHTVYGDVMADVSRELALRATQLKKWGLRDGQIALDPGLGFAKTAAQSLELLHRIGELKGLGHPVLLGASRKSFLGRVSGEALPEKRDPETLAAMALAFQSGIRFFRVHNVAAARAFFSVWSGD